MKQRRDWILFSSLTNTDHKWIDYVSLQVEVRLQTLSFPVRSSDSEPWAVFQPWSHVCDLPICV